MATAVDTTSWRVSKKVSLPEINMNNPHNMWASIDQDLIYQTQWFDTKLTVFNRKNGKLVHNIEVGEAPAHVMTRGLLSAADQCVVNCCAGVARPLTD